MACACLDGGDRVRYAKRNIFSHIGNFGLSLVVVRVIARRTLREFWEHHPDCEQRLKTWYKETEEAIWTGPNDVKREYPSASIIANDRVVFNIKGNKYRLIVKINYHYGMVWIRFIGTHAEYDRIDAATI